MLTASIWSSCSPPGKASTSSWGRAVNLACVFGPQTPLAMKSALYDIASSCCRYSGHDRFSYFVVPDGGRHGRFWGS